MFPVGLQPFRVEPGGDEEIGGFVVEVVEVAGDEVGAVAEFEVAPEHLDGIEFGGVGRQVFEGEAGVAFQQFADRRALVHRAVIPDRNDLAFEVFEQVAEEGGDAGGIVLAVYERLEIEIATETFWRDRQGGDRGDFLTGSGELTKPRPASPLRPGTAAER